MEVVDTEASFPVLEGERILAAARRAGIWLPFECGWGSCGTCKVTLVEGEVAGLLPDAPSLSVRDARRNRILLCQSTPVSDLVVKPGSVSRDPRENFRTADSGAVLVERERLGPDIGRFRFELDQAVAYREGQHAILDTGEGLRRCYSMASLAGDAEIEFIAKRYEGRRGSERLFSLEPGTLVSVELPYGEMWVRDSGQRICLVAGGTGIAPILAILRRLEASGDTRETQVFFGANTREELVCWDEIVALADKLASGRVTGALAAPPAGWPGARGFVTDALRAALPDMPDATFYIAGPPVMTDAVLALLREHDVQLSQVHYDSFG